MSTEPSLTISSDGNLIVSGGIDKKIRIWDLEKNSLLPPIQAHDNFIRGMRFSPNNQLFASASIDKTIKIWDRQGKLVKQFNYGDYAYDVDFNSNGQKIAASGRNRGITIWDLKTSLIVGNIREEKLVLGKSYKIYKLDFHPFKEATLIATGYKGHDIVLSNLIQKNSSPKYFGENTVETASVRFSNDGKMIASCDESGNINIRNLNGKLLAKIKNSDDSIRRIEFSLDGTKIASLDASGNVKIWDINEALTRWKSFRDGLIKPHNLIQVGDGSISQIAFIRDKLDPSNTVLVSADTLGFVRLWNISKDLSNKKKEDIQQMLKTGCSMLSTYAKRESNIKIFLLETCTK